MRATLAPIALGRDSEALRAETPRAVNSKECR